MKKYTIIAGLALFVCVLFVSVLFSASTPQIITFQGQLKESGYSVTGTKSMRFAVVNAAGTVIWQSHATNGVTVTVNNGVYTVGLGDTSITNMSALTAAALDKGEKLYLRVFVEGTQLSPDILLAASAYAYIAGQAETVTANAAAGDSIGAALGQATQPVVMPRLNDTQMNSVASPANGSVIFNTTKQQLYWHDGSYWLPMGGTSANASYDTGWVACSDWTDQHLGTALGGNVVHNLNANLSGLIVKVLVSTDGTDTNSFEIGTESWSYPANFNYNYTVSQINSNTIKVQTGLDGLLFYNDQGVAGGITVTAWYYKVIVYKPNSIIKGANATDYVQKSGDTMTGSLAVAGTVNVTTGKVAESGNALVPAGSIQMFAGATTPNGWLMCDGAAVSRTTYASLFAAIGTIYGTGDGSTTFNLPDFRGAAPAGAGTSTGYVQNETVTLGAKIDDSFQGHKTRHINYQTMTGGTGYWVKSNSSTAGNQENTDSSIIADGVNGNPRTGLVTKGKTVGVNFIIKY